MNIYPLVFSNNSKYRIARHSLFWLLWILYYTIFTTISFSEKHAVVQSFFSALLETTISVPMDIIYCYSIIYFLLPKFLFRGKYIQMVLLWLLFSTLFIISFHLYSVYLLPHIRSLCGMSAPVNSSNYTWIFFSLFSQVNMEGGLAAAIKLGKTAFIKQQELDLITKERLHIEPQMQAGQVPPVFLLSALDKVELIAQEKPALIPAIIKKIKYLLLYVIYDSNQSAVSIETEMKLVEEYIELEKICTDDKLSINLKILVNNRGARIAPSILLPLVENCFKQLAAYDIPRKNINIEMKLADDAFSMDIFLSKPADTSTLLSAENTLFKNISKRLNLLYPQSNDFKIIIRPDQLHINLAINLQAVISK
ncbi:MAG TPA: histidine kinase [Panacibacter sp.]|nr:histidine kinase [Panacibacter sp.]